MALNNVSDISKAYQQTGWFESSQNMNSFKPSLIIENNIDFKRQALISQSVKRSADIQSKRISEDKNDEFDAIDLVNLGSHREVKT